MLWKCETCGFQLRAEEEPAGCDNCKANKSKSKGFAEIADPLPPSEAQAVDYHWQCQTCGYKFGVPTIPTNCPNCDRQGKKSEGYKPLSSAATAERDAERLKDRSDQEEKLRGEKPRPVNSWTRGEIIQWLIEMGMKAVAVDGKPKLMEDCVIGAKPTKADLLGLAEIKWRELNPDKSISS